MARWYREETDQDVVARAENTTELVAEVVRVVQDFLDDPPQAVVWPQLVKAVAHACGFAVGDVLAQTDPQAMAPESRLWMLADAQQILLTGVLDGLLGDVQDDDGR
jgi:hypothetical protein